MWFRPYPVCAEESGGEGSGAGGAAPVADGEGSPASQEPALSPLHWAAALPAEEQAFPIVKDATSLLSFVRSAKATKEFVGDPNRVSIPKGYDPVKGPGEGVDLAPMFRKLGMPEKPTEYTVDRGEIPEGIQITVNEDEQRQFLEEAHQAGLAPWQVNRLAKWHTRNEIAKKNREAGEAASAIARGTAQLYEMHGANTPHVQKDGQFVVEKLMADGLWGDPALAERVAAKFEKAGFWTDPDVMTGMATLGEQMRGGRYLGAGQPISGAETAADVESKLKALTATIMARGSSTATEEQENDRLNVVKQTYQAMGRM